METNQAPVTTPSFDINALLMTALAPVVQHMTAPLLARIAVLEEKVSAYTGIDEERIKEIAEDAAREVLSEHTDEYDHDSYDRLEDKLSDMVTEAFDDHDMDDKIREAIGGLTFSLRVA